MTTDLLASFPDDAPVRYLTEREAGHNCEQYAKIFWEHPFLKAKQVLEIIQEHRAHNDFAKRRTAVHIDFLRKYYHTRTKRKSVSLQDIDGEHEYIQDNSQDIANVVGNDWVEKFYDWLGNGGVSKRISKIRDILSAFVEWQIDLEDAPPPESAPSTVRYDVIEFTYTRK